MTDLTVYYIAITDRGCNESHSLFLNNMSNLKSLSK
nr:MAG TPA: hypothetical protein [Crassvirales sp.]